MEKTAADMSHVHPVEIAQVDGGRGSKRRPRSRSRYGSADTVVAVGDLVIDGPRHRVSIGSRNVELTPTEFAFLSVLARHPGEVVAHEEILHAVWGPDAEDTQYVRVYAAQLRKKLADDPCRPRLITEPRVGLRLVDPLEGGT
jgi:two-component system KDP operon response regulator KdpE